MYRRITYNIHTSIVRRSVCSGFSLVCLLALRTRIRTCIRTSDISYNILVSIHGGTEFSSWPLYIFHVHYVALHVVFSIVVHGLYNVYA